MATMAFLLASVGALHTSAALPPNAPAGLRAGANHHTGDDGFVAHLGRSPGPGDEKLRMHEHFVAVRARLAARKATRPELEATRQKILGYLDAYIAKGTTPDNAHLPWRTPVFIDDAKTICAVGYLIEQSAGRPLADKIAAAHRYDFIEDIAKDMPEVAAWVASSGFTLDELGQIQPGYRGPDVLLWHAWPETEDLKIEDGPYALDDLRGTFRHRKMEGTWVREVDETVRGRGQFHRGNGAWTSYFASGAVLAEGRYANNKPSGPWRFFHESGHLAAEGRFWRGQRVGDWKFYYDVAEPTPIAAGRFDGRGFVEGTWNHYDANGALLATSVVSTPDSFTKKRKEQLFWSIGYLVDVVPTANHLAHRIHQGSIDGAPIRLDLIASGDERVYLHGDDVYDSDGHRLVRTDAGWRADDCHWSKAKKRFARAGDVSALHGLIFQGSDETAETCTTGVLVSPARAARVAALVGSMDEVRSASPAFVQQLALEDERPTDLTNVIASSMSLDIEWPHVDGRFVQVYKTLPGLTHEN
jgi:hypothetical protein